MSIVAAARGAALYVAGSRWRCRVVRNFCTSRCLRGEQKGNVLDTLSSRSLLAQVTAPNSLRKHLNGPERRSVYVGVDPSADSLHVGNLLPLVAALHFAQHGHRVIVVIGGATGSIGDPSGRSTERSALTQKELDHNVGRITRQVQDFFHSAEKLVRGATTTTPTEPEEAQREAGKKAEPEMTPMQAAAEASDVREAEVASEIAMDEAISAPVSGILAKSDDGEGGQLSPSNITVVNNQEWYENMNVLTFLRDVGKFARIGSMLARDSVKSRLQPSDASGSSHSPVGLSFTEFSYQLLQAYDFSVLHGAPWHCTVQLGGSDQMGNIMAGVELIRRQSTAHKAVEEDEDSDETPAYGLTLPLLTTASGAKFGKSAGNAVWLSSEKCSDFDFYQFFLRSRDDEVELYLKTLTLLPIPAIARVLREHAATPSARIAQKMLASQVTELVRGSKAVKRAESATRVLFEVDLQGLNAVDVLDAFATDPRLQKRRRDECIGVDLRQLAMELGLTRSKGEARRFVDSGGFYINNRPVDKLKRSLILEESDLISDGKIVVLRLGKTEHRILSISM